MSSLSSLSSIAASERHRLLSAVAAVVEGIEPLDNQVEPLNMLLILIEESVRPIVTSELVEAD